MQFPSVGLFTTIFLAEGFPLLSLTGRFRDLEKVSYADRHCTPTLFLLSLRQISTGTARDKDICH